MPDDPQIRLARAQRSLEGLSVGDAFGQQAFTDPGFVQARTLPRAPWRWTDDTHMAISVVEILQRHQDIDPDALAIRFAERFAEEPWRGYAGGAVRLLTAVAAGRPWRREAAALFGGQGSYGNGSAMRVAPVGAYFADDPARAALAARRQAMVTHAHPEAREAAAAIALGTAQLAVDPGVGADALLQGVIEALTDSETRRRLEHARRIPAGEHAAARLQLGTGHQVAGFDTAPFCLWIAAHHRDWSDALYATAAGFGDVDTTCAIVGGLLAVPCGGPPAAWRACAEALPDGLGEPSAEGRG